MKQRALIFGSSGTIGSCIHKDLISKDYDIYTAGKSNRKNQENHINIDYSLELESKFFKNLPTLDVVIWSHGLNCSDTVENFKVKNLSEIINSNVIFIASCISNLLNEGKLREGARLLIISSIWQIECRKNKFSYSVSKSALQGLIKSAAIDLGCKNILINGILPGVIDSPMTRMHLTEEQINKVTTETALGRLPTGKDIAMASNFLISPLNKSITGQFIIVDGGFLGLKNNL